MAPPTALVATITVPNLDYKKGVKHLLDSTPALSAVPSAFIVPDPSALSHPIVTPPCNYFPVIDIGKLTEGPADRASIIEDIVSACANGGFFLAVNHGIKPSTMSDYLGAVEGFFALPVEEKLKYASNFHDVAPVSYGSTSNDEASQPRQFWRDFLRHFDHPVEPQNCHLLPTNPANYAELANEFMMASWELAMNVAGAISLGLGKEADYLQGTLGEGLQAIACNYYPPCPQPELAVGVGAHTDPPAITILFDNGVDGLQFRNGDGVWVPVPHHVPGALVVSLGRHTEGVTGGKMKAAAHRVVVNELAGRVSVAVGSGPELKLLPSHPFGHDFL